MEDHEIVALFFERDEAALTEISRKYSLSLRSLCLRILGNPEDAEECLNDTYHCLWNKIPPEQPEHLLGYALRIARNLALKKREYLSAEKRNTASLLSLDELEECIPDENDPAQSLQAAELTAAIERWLDKQTKQNRIIFLRRFFFLDAEKEIAAWLGISEDAVEARLRRMKADLKKHLIKGGYWE